MHKRIKLFFVLVLLSAFIHPVSAYADQYTATIEVFRNFDTVKPFFRSAYGYAVFPTVGKGGFVVGGSFGKGKVYRDEIITGDATLAKASIGFQLGGQAYSEIIFFEDKRAYDEFTSGNFEFDAAASAVAITAGLQATAGTTGVSAGASISPSRGAQAGTVYRKGMITFIHIKGGLMYEASVGGQAFNFKPIKQ